MFTPTQPEESPGSLCNPQYHLMSTNGNSSEEAESDMDANFIDPGATWLFRHFICSGQQQRPSFPIRIALFKIRSISMYRVTSRLPNGCSEF